MTDKWIKKLTKLIPFRSSDDYTIVNIKLDDTRHILYAHGIK